MSNLVYWIDQLSISTQPDQKFRAVQQIALLKDPKSLGVLVRTLQTANLELTELILDALGELADTRAVSPLLSYLTHANEDIRASAFSSLLKIGQDRAGTIVQQPWQNQQVDPLTQVAWQLDQEAIQILLSALQQPQTTNDVKIGAIYTLGHLGIVNSLPLLVQNLFESTDEDVQCACAYALGELAMNVHQRETYQYVIQAFERIWGHANVELRVSMSKALADMEQQISYQLLHHAMKDQEGRVRQLATMGLGRLKSNLNLPTLYLALKDKDVDVRRNAVYAISNIGDIESWKHFVMAVADELEHGHGADMRTAVSMVVNRFNLPAINKQLRQYLQSPIEYQRAAIAHLFASTADAEALLHLSKDQSAKVRKQVALAIGHLKISHPQLRNCLESLLDDHEWEVRVAAAEGLKRLGDLFAIPRLERQLNDQHSVVQNAVKSALKALQEKQNSLKIGK